MSAGIIPILSVLPCSHRSNLSEADHSAVTDERGPVCAHRAFGADSLSARCLNCPAVIANPWRGESAGGAGCADPVVHTTCCGRYRFSRTRLPLRRQVRRRQTRKPTAGWSGL